MFVAVGVTWPYVVPGKSLGSTRTSRTTGTQTLLEVHPRSVCSRLLGQPSEHMHRGVCGTSVIPYTTGLLPSDTCSRGTVVAIGVERSRGCSPERVSDTHEAASSVG